MNVLIALLIAGNMLYPNAGKIESVNIPDDTVTICDESGNLWDFYGVEDWQEGDKVAMIMSDNRTEIIYDDEIVDVRYIGR